MESNIISQSQIPLCVDLDGTLVKTDTLHEQILRLLKANVLYLFLLPFWMLAGKASFKANIAKKVKISVSALPYDLQVLEYIQEQKKLGRSIFLVTGCHKIIAKKIAEYLNLFDDVFATDSKTNLTGSNKAKFLIDKFGDGKFDYFGNEKADYKVWQHSNMVAVVGASKFCLKVEQKYENVKIFDRTKASLKTYLKAIRVHQWVKNCLIFIPLILDNQLTILSSATDAVLGFFAFSFMASATYIINDLLDLESDRSHHKKKYRAFAAGDISILTSIILGILLSIASIAILCFLSIEFAIVSIIYLISTLLYSFRLKTMAILDACVLAGLFTIRVVGGTTVIGADWSFWLLAFSMFFFLSLAFTKRASELNALLKIGKKQAKGRGYSVADIGLVTSMGISAGYIGILVIAFYINSEKVISNYANPYILWLICPLLLYWIGRIWMKTVRGEMNEDPIVFALKDKVSHISAIIIAIVVFLASIQF